MLKGNLSPERTILNMNTEDTTYRLLINIKVGFHHMDEEI